METIIRQFTDAVSEFDISPEKVEQYKKELMALIYVAYLTEVYEFYSEEEINEIRVFTGEDIEKLVELFNQKQILMNEQYPEITVESVGLPILKDYLKNVFNI